MCARQYRLEIQCRIAFPPNHRTPTLQAPSFRHFLVLEQPIPHCDNFQSNSLGPPNDAKFVTNPYPLTSPTSIGIKPRSRESPLTPFGNLWVVVIFLVITVSLAHAPLDNIVPFMQSSSTAPLPLRPNHPLLKLSSSYTHSTWRATPFRGTAVLYHFLTSSIHRRAYYYQRIVTTVLSVRRISPRGYHHLSPLAQTHRCIGIQRGIAELKHSQAFACCPSTSVESRHTNLRRNMTPLRYLYGLLNASLRRVSGRHFYLPYFVILRPQHPSV